MAELHYRIHGPRDAPVVLLAHGFPFDGMMWTKQIGPLTAAGFRVVVPDLRGFGRSEPQPDASMDAMADDLVALLDRERIETAIVVGFSMGGYVALSFAVRFQHRLRALVLCDTRAEPDGEEARAKRYETIADVKARGVQVVASAMMSKLVTTAALAERAALVSEVREMMLRQSVAGVVAALAGLAERPDRQTQLAGIAVPTLVMVGADDTVTPVAASEALAAGIPGALLAVIPGAAHLSPMEQPQTFNRLLVDFLGALA